MRPCEAPLPRSSKPVPPDFASFNGYRLAKTITFRSLIFVLRAFEDLDVGILALCNADGAQSCGAFFQGLAQQSSFWRWRWSTTPIAARAGDNDGVREEPPARPARLSRACLGVRASRPRAITMAPSNTRSAREASRQHTRCPSACRPTFSANRGEPARRLTSLTPLSPAISIRWR